MKTFRDEGHSEKNIRSLPHDKFITQNAGSRPGLLGFDEIIGSTP